MTFLEYKKLMLEYAEYDAHRAAECNTWKDRINLYFALPAIIIGGILCFVNDLAFSLLWAVVMIPLYFVRGNLVKDWETLRVKNLEMRQDCLDKIKEMENQFDA